MHLDKLELHGFKSFADRTALKILPGITAIVGPNGCGKTNIVDAISWVLGSQSPRRLRGSKMEDVIFSGSSSRPAVGFAEVTLTFDNSDGRLPVEYSEVSFSRRLYRSGESEYLLNGGRCRLKDIQNLILGTGLGNQSYSVIEQGRLEWIINSRPEERRALLEEAAGISKFRSHKEEALRKLEHVSNNLLRVEDIVREVKRQLRQAEKQAVQAQRYGQLRDRFRELETSLAAFELKGMREEEERIEAELKEWEAKLETSRSAADALEEEVVRFRETMRSRRRLCEQRRARAFAAESELATSRGRVKLNQERRAELGAVRDQAAAEITTLEAALAGSREDVERLSERLESLRKSNRAKEKETRAVEKEMDGLRRELVEIEKGFAVLQTEMVESSRDEIHVRNEYSTLEAGEKALLLRRRRLEVDLERISDERKGVEKELSAAAEKTGPLETIAREVRGKLSDERERSVRLEERLSTLRAEREEVASAAREKTARLEMLREWEAAGTGSLESVKIVRREAAAGAIDGKSVFGMLADLIEVEPGGEKVVAAAWGENLWAVMVQDWKTAAAVIDRLRELRAPGLRLIVAEELSRSARSASPAAEDFPCRLLPPWDGLKGALIDALGGNSSAAAPGLDSADDCAFPGPGVIAWAGTESPAVKTVSRKQQLEELSRQTATLSNRAREVAESVDRAEAEREELAGAVRESERAVREAELNLMLNRSERERLNNELEKIELQSKGLRGEIEELEGEKENLSRRRRELEGVLEAGTGRQEELSLRTGEWKRRKEEAEKQASSVSEKLTSFKIDLASCLEREDSLARRLEELNRERDKTVHLINNRRSQMEGAKNREREIEEENLRLEKIIAALEEELKSLSPEIEALDSEIEELEVSLRSREEKQHSLRPGYHLAQEELNSRRTLLAQLRVRMEGLFQRIREKYDLDLESVVSPPGPIDPESAGRELEKIKADMEKMGMVNLAALESKETLDERLAHLTGQRDDLVGAKADLEAAIKKINVTAREKLESTYNDVREHFRYFFKELFSGGKADLRLDGAGDILESGLEIVAQPPGKKLTNLSLLSGGEKALTTIALIFALFRIQPSPFYILDEMDAPLDESNIGRFSRLLREFSGRSQFIIITHNKRTISEADILYGITMEELGVSRVVSVKLGKN